MVGSSSSSDSKNPHNSLTARIISNQDNDQYNNVIIV